MATRHMTDEELQAYLDKGPSFMDQVFHAHLGECSECRARLHQYRAVYDALAVEQEFELSDGFADRVMARVATESVGHAKRSWGGLLAMAAGVILAFGVTAYYVDFAPIMNQFASLFQPSVQAGVKAIDDAHKTVDSGTGNTLMIVLFSLLILGAIAGADHLLFRHRGEKVCL